MPLVPLAVDLDGSLVKQDTSWLLAKQFAARGPLSCAQLAVWFLAGARPHLKAKLCEREALNVSSLLVHATLLDYLREQKQKGRRLVLATGTNEKIANQVADHFGLFEAVFASDAVTNLTGVHKAQRLCKEFGDKGFSYVGNTWIDLHVWKHASSAVIVSDSAALVRAAAQLTMVEKHFKLKHALCGA